MLMTGARSYGHRRHNPYLRQRHLAQSVGWRGGDQCHVHGAEGLSWRGGLGAGVEDRIDARARYRCLREPEWHCCILDIS